MNNLLIFFAFPIAVIILSVILNNALHNPFSVASLIFAVFIVVTFAAFDETFLIATLAYTILGFITALLSDRLLNCNNALSNNHSKNNSCLCDTLIESIETNNSTNTGNAYDTNINLETSISKADNVINDNCGHLYNRRCRRF